MVVRTIMSGGTNTRPADAHAPGRANIVRLIAGAAWRRRRSVIALVVLALLVGYAGMPLLLGPEVAAERVQRHALVQSVVASGRVETPYRVEIGSQITGTVATIPVAEGQFVRVGDPLITLEDSEARAALVQAEGAVAQAEARVRQIRELTLPSAEQGLRQAQANLVNARNAYERAATLHRDGYTTTAQFDEAQRSYNVAQSQMRAAEFQVQTNRPGGSDAVMAETQLAQAQANLRTARARLDYTVIRAPADGTLIARNVERGYVVQPGRALMLLSPLGEVQLVVQIDERNMGVLAVGQPALASADAYPNQTFAAQLTYINPAVDPQRGSVEVKLRASSPPGYLRQDMTVSVDIEVARRPDALTIPRTALAAGPNGATGVLVIEDGRVHRRNVRLGVRGDERVEVLDGLREGDIVVVGATGRPAEGVRVRPRLP